jgi:multiple sugar transport system permease protein
MTQKHKNAWTIGNVAYWFCFALFAIFTLFPIVWVGLMAFKTPIDIIAVPPKFVFTPTLDNFREVLSQGDFLNYYRNTFIIAAGAVGLTLIVGTPAAYVLARYDFKFKEDLAFTFLSFRFAPELAVIIPLFVIFQQLKLYDSYLGLILIYQAITLPLLIWLMRGYFEDVPKDIEQAAKVDGAGWWQIFTRISIPLVLPGIAAAAVLAFIFSWNALVFGLVLGGRETYPVTIGLLGYMGYQNVDWGPMAAATLVTIIPEFILASFVLRSLVRGLTFGAVHGG